MSDTQKQARRVQPRKLTLAGIAAGALVVAQPMVIGGVLNSVAAWPAGAETGEGGEAGEGGVVLTEGPAEFLTSLGYFEGTYRIAARLYLAGAHGAAAEHLEDSHHAFYEDIVEQIDAYGASGFADEAAAFTTAIMQDQGDDAVRASYDALMAKVAENASAAGASAYDQAMSIHDLIALASAEYEGGVDEGTVIVPIEFRDSWGFYETAKARAEAFARNADPAIAAAGDELLEYLAPVEALYPSLSSETAGPDPVDLVVATGWSEIIALRLK